MDDKIRTLILHHLVPLRTRLMSSHSGRDFLFGKTEVLMDSIREILLERGEEEATKKRELIDFRGSPLTKMQPRDRELGRDMPEGQVPHSLDMPIEPDLLPCLVSGSARSCVWVDRLRVDPLSQNQVIRAAIHKGSTVSEFYQEVIRSIASRGRSMKWGNSHPLTERGLESAVEHVTSYGIDTVDIVANEGSSWLLWDKMPVKPASWVPDDHVVVLPREKDLVGFLMLWDSDSFISVIANPSRMVGIAWEGCDEPSGEVVE